MEWIVVQWQDDLFIVDGVEPEFGSLRCGFEFEHHMGIAADELGGAVAYNGLGPISNRLECRCERYWSVNGRLCGACYEYENGGFGTVIAGETESAKVSATYLGRLLLSYRLILQ